MRGCSGCGHPLAEDVVEEENIADMAEEIDEAEHRTRSSRSEDGTGQEAIEDLRTRRDEKDNEKFVKEKSSRFCLCARLLAETRAPLAVTAILLLLSLFSAFSSWRHAP